MLLEKHKTNVMKSLLNSVRLFGHVGKDPVIMDFESGNKLAKWSMATHEKKKTKSGEVEDEVQWHNLIAWGSLAKMVEDYVKKGMKLSIEGKLSYRSYVNKDGVEVRTSEILVKDVLLVERKIEREEEVEADESEAGMPF
mgnify:CR=1 FL=1